MATLSAEQKRVGKVSLTILESSIHNKLNRGSFDEKLAKALSTTSQQTRAKKITAMLASDPNWEALLHLAPQRGNLVSWFPFKKGARLLEIGAGFGGLTGAFLAAGLKVTAIERNQERALALANRYRENANLEVVSADFSEYPDSSKFDYVFSSLAMSKGQTFTKISSSLRSGANILVAGDNRLALKYWSGAADSSTGRFFDSIEGYPYDKQSKTLSLAAIQKTITNAKCKVELLYYPVPDFVMPVEVYSTNFLPTNIGKLPGWVFPSSSQGKRREDLFSEVLAMSGIIRDGLFTTYANSYLVVARKTQ